MSVSQERGEQKTGLRVAFETLGCRSNYADSVDLQAALAERGATPCSFASDADVYVVNTCTVTDAADKDSLRLIRKVQARAPKARIVVTGCMAEVSADQLRELAKVDVIIGPGRREELLGAILECSAEKSGGLEESAGRLTAEQFPSESRLALTRLRRRRSISLEQPISAKVLGPGSRLGEITQRSRYHLRIQEGCENYCTYCIVPQTRGSYSSRSVNEILDDLRHLAKVGYEEVVLSGTHLGGYGRDINTNLLELLSILAEKRPLPRIRLSSIDPNDLGRELLDLFVQSNVFCRHLHICVQAFSDSILKRMNRKYRLADVQELLCYIEQTLPDCCIGSDVIAGFPGESRQEVDEEIERFLRLPISYLHVFPYSERSGTAAVRLDGVVEPGERKRRAARWRAEGERKRDAFFSQLVGSDLEIILERLDSEFAYGTSRQYAFVKIPADEVLASGAQLGSRVSVRVLSYEQVEKKVLCQLLSRENSV